MVSDVGGVLTVRKISTVEVDGKVPFVRAKSQWLNRPVAEFLSENAMDFVYLLLKVPENWAAESRQLHELAQFPDVLEFRGAEMYD
jgi:hypothetical protein